ncbi:Uncharacterized protein PRO82_001347 [Candidatus Protochlamydia amoebophila]|uniref:hypothetical protein n=1 Tax=Candidatus Protochlamydia amoebophila TaxID=362787 RepID=UPI001BC97FB9|nr:hypothetical protein [Candidatus Protochlamydia amoebophila]MBS4164034.1 Uncharacterized protein [Candidatus Protochlamydia amoebophila]
MAVSPDGNYLASVDWENFYIWNLKTLEVEKQPLEIESSQTCYHCFSEIKNPQTFFQFFQESQFIFKAASKKGGKTPQKPRIEIWKIAPLEMISSSTIEDIDFFSLLAITQDEKVLISIGRKDDGESFNRKTEICLWQIDFNDQKLPQITPIKTKIIRGSVQECSYAPKTSIIAIINADNPFLQSRVELYTLPNLEIKQEWILRSLEGKRKFLNSMIFNHQENQLIINIFTEINKTFREFKSKIYSWNIKNKQKKKLFFEKHPISNLQILPDSSKIAYFVDKGNETLFRIRDKDFKLNFSKRFSINKSGNIPRREILDFIFNDQFIFRLKDNQISITSLKTFVGKKELPLSIRDMYFSPDEQTITFWNYLSYLDFSSENFFNKNIENKLYSYQTFNGKNLGHKKLPTFFIERESGEGCLLSFDAQYCIRTYPSESNGKNKMIIFQVENEEVQASYAGSFIRYFLSKDNRYLVFIYQNHSKLIEIDFKKHNQLVDVDSNDQKLSVFHPYLFSKEKITCTFSEPLFPITTLALKNVETGNISLWKINWEIPLIQGQVQGMVLWRTKLPFSNFFWVGQSKFYFQKDKQTLNIWDKETFSEKTINFENELVNFDISDDGSWMVTAEKLVSSMNLSAFFKNKTKFCLWNLDQMKELDHFILPFGHSTIRLSPKGKFLIVNQESNFAQSASVRKVKKGKFYLLWKTPRYLNLKGLSLKNTQNLDAKNTLLLTQLQNKKVLDENI